MQYDCFEVSDKQLNAKVQKKRTILYDSLIRCFVETRHATSLRILPTVNYLLYIFPHFLQVFFHPVGIFVFDNVEQDSQLFPYVG